MNIMHPLHNARSLWARVERAVKAKSSTSTSSILKRWRRSWARKVAWPWFKREIEIVSKITGVVVLSIWTKRLVEQCLEKRVVNEPMLRGEINDIVRSIEEDVEERRTGHARTRE